jgi:hypothetical protein
VNSPNPHAAFNVPWSVEDSDDNLETVELTLTQTSPSGGVEEQVTIDVSGETGTVTGTTTLQAKHDDGRSYTYDATLVVTDSTGNTGGETKSITEDGA